MVNCFKVERHLTFGVVFDESVGGRHAGLEALHLTLGLEAYLGAKLFDGELSLAEVAHAARGVEVRHGLNLVTCEAVTDFAPPLGPDVVDLHFTVVDGSAAVGAVTVVLAVDLETLLLVHLSVSFRFDNLGIDIGKRAKEGKDSLLVFRGVACFQSQQFDGFVVKVAVLAGIVLGGDAVDFLGDGT